MHGIGRMHVLEAGFDQLKTLLQRGDVLLASLARNASSTVERCVV